ncbi:EAL and HDOD domain-containing protein [Noviherbaspirillum galbum]|uniref:HDOD domain-containing protein n=1 Tax=Noviherbaspirillum galbum TaxID=2709383 RepID=A0A6B3SPA3_9BURK|nr:HDOD domain-containing protein [Noviherbaspirillum galbum]NEX62664.1 HDOD domain-containing protein [Noviherbaspirillum galbum]
MQQELFIVREPLLNTQERVLGYELAWQHVINGGAAPTEAEATELVHFVAAEMSDNDDVAPLNDHLVFLEVPVGLMTGNTVDFLPSKGVVLVVRGADLAMPGAIESLATVRAKGFGVCLREANLPGLDKAVLPHLSYVELPVTAGDFAAQLQAYKAFGMPAIKLIARQVSTWQAYDLCASVGMFSFVGKLHLSPRSGQRVRDLNPAQTIILQLMDMVRKNADVKQLEGVLKRDAALSYKLLRFINSAGFGLGCEIQSLKHAVTMLGYSPLYRWLALLLATATTTGYSPVLLQTAVIRGRFAELIGQGFLPKNEAENLFVAGMFSLLDKLLGVPMEDILEKIQLSEPVTQALLSREGIYGPFLALAEASELNNKELERMASSLCISGSRINDCHLSALAWAQNIEL